MKKTKSRIIVILLVASVICTGLPMLSGGTAYAASPYWKNAHAASDGTTVIISWTALTKKQKKKIHGIAVFRDGDPIKQLGKTSKSYTDSSLQAGTVYTYQLKTYKKTTKKTKMWFNKQTGEYQKKKPVKKYRGNRKTFKTVTYKYYNASAPMKVATQKAPEPTPTPKPDPTPEPDPMPAPTPTPTPTPEVKQVEITDYTGKVRTVSEDSKYCNDARYNRDIDGIFLAQSSDNYPYVPDGKKIGEYYYVQKNGVTFHVEHCNGGYSIRVYNGDAKKVTIDLSRKEYSFTKWGNEMDNPSSETSWYILGDNGRRLAEVERYSGDTVSSVSTIDLYYDFGVVEMTAKYDGEVIDTYTETINYEGNTGSDGFSPGLRNAYDIAKSAVSLFENGGSLEGQYTQEWYKELINNYGEYYANMKAIEAYVYEKYSYDEMDCWGGYAILDAYSVIVYGKYGNWTNPHPSSSGHMAFRPDEYCEQGSFNNPPYAGKGSYFETNGHH